jgi:hypothetical protein
MQQPGRRLVNSNIPAAHEPVRVFFSYSHKDEELRDLIAEQLRELEREQLIEGWHDRRLMAGEMWDEQISEQLETAQIILVLVSPAFLESHYCTTREMARAIARAEANETRLVPVILRPCNWSDTPLVRFQALPANARPVVEWENLQHALDLIRQGIANVVGQVRSVEQRARKARIEALRAKVEGIEVSLKRIRAMEMEGMRAPDPTGLYRELASTKRELMLALGDRRGAMVAMLANIAQLEHAAMRADALFQAGVGSVEDFMLCQRALAEQQEELARLARSAPEIWAEVSQESNPG